MGGLIDWKRLKGFALKDESARTMGYKAMQVREGRKTEVNILFCKQSFIGVQGPPHHWHSLIYLMSVN